MTIFRRRHEPRGAPGLAGREAQTPARPLAGLLVDGWHDAPPGSAYDGTFDVVVSPGEVSFAMEAGDLERAMDGTGVRDARTALAVGACWTVAWGLVACAVIWARSRARPPGAGRRIRRRVMSR